MTVRLISPGWATYLRVSDEDKQTPERSFAMQRQRIMEQLLTVSELPFKREYMDTLTGTSPNRKDYQQMLSDAETGLFSHLGLYRADRFGRNTVEGLQAATRLIGLGIKIRVAHMPSLRPEEPDGFFMFLIQMGMAQREVDVLKQRTADGMEAKLRAGGWPNRAPAGYINKERQIASNKYERWVELDPEYYHVIREAWDLLLTDRYTLDEICEELARRGYLRASGRPWAWNDKVTGKRHDARSHLQHLFHNPFYTGWADSRRFGISYGEVQGKWEPIVSTEEYERGVEILRKHDAEKSRIRVHQYLLRNLLWIQAGDKTFKMFGTTPSGRSKSYSYYMTQAKVDGKRIHIPCEVIDCQIDPWLQRITIERSLLPTIREVYEQHLKQVSQEKRETKSSELKLRLNQLREEEVRIGRLLITEKITEETFDRLKQEWKQKIHQVQTDLSEIEREAIQYVDELGIALILLSKAYMLFNRLKEKERSILLQILAKRIIVNQQGEIINHELNSPFTYLRSLADRFQQQNHTIRGSEQEQTRLLILNHSSSGYPKSGSPTIFD